MRGRGSAEAGRYGSTETGMQGDTEAGSPREALWPSFLFAFIAALHASTISRTKVVYRSTELVQELVPLYVFDFRLVVGAACDGPTPTLGRPA